MEVSHQMAPREETVILKKSSDNKVVANHSVLMKRRYIMMPNYSRPNSLYIEQTATTFPGKKFIPFQKIVSNFSRTVENETAISKT